MPISPLGALDHLYALLKNSSGRAPDASMFWQGWGDAAAIAEVRQQVCSGAAPADIRIRWTSPWTPHLGHHARDGYFETPYFRQYLPPECRLCRFRLIVPRLGPPCPVYLHMATSNEEGYVARERSLALPLLKRGCGSLILEQPYHGRRRPAEQGSTRLRHVSDLLLLGGAAVEEARALLQWLHDSGYRHLGVSGVSIGGHLAALAGVRLSFGIAIVPYVAPHSAVPVFTEGLIKNACDWKTLSGGKGDTAQSMARFRQHVAFTGLENFPPPREDSRVVAVAALDDSFVPRHSTDVLVRHWPDAEFRWVRGGHVSSILGRRRAFVLALSDAMMRLQQGRPARLGQEHNAAGAIM
jgi:hypothetical protein